jgi:hypothetical protein
VIFHVHAWDAIPRGRHHEAVVEADFERARFDIAVPVRSAFAAEAQVPFADDTGFVPDLFQDGGDGWRAGRNA